MSERALRATEAAQLKSEGLNGIEIAEAMGISRSYACELLSDPEGTAARERKDGYRGTCVDCGALTNGSAGLNAPERCVPCTGAHEKRWTPDAILEAIRVWAAVYGRPPRTTEWKRAGVNHPTTTTVVVVWGWNEAIKAAGFEPIHTSPGPNTVTPGVLAETVELQREHGTREAARLLGISPNAVRQRLERAGERSPVSRRDPVAIIEREIAHLEREISQLEERIAEKRSESERLTEARDLLSGTKVREPVAA